MRPPSRRILFLLAPLLLAGLLLPGERAVSLAQQSPAPQAPQARPPQKPDDAYRIRRDVNLVVLHATVVDERGRFVPDLRQDNFRVYEDRVEQKVAVFRREDIPVSVGLVVDNSASMREKRERVNAAALAFVEASNREDEVFVVNFNDDYYLDLDKDFTNDLNELKEALERIDSRGLTALFDAVVGSLDHLKKGSRDKKVLVVITDGDDNASRIGHGNKRHALELTVLEAQKSDALIYTVGLFGTEKGGDARRAREALVRLATASGGQYFFPESVQSVGEVCAQIAHDIRNQYTLAYYPTNMKKDGTFRAVQVDVSPPRGRGKLSVRTRTGYFAQRESAGN